MDFVTGFPDAREIQQSLLICLYLDGGEEHKLQTGDAYRIVANRLGLSEEQRKVTRDDHYGDGRSESAWYNKLQWARRKLKDQNYLDVGAGRGIWRLSEEGIREAKRLLESDVMICPFCFEISYVKRRCGSCGMRGNGKFLREYWAIDCEQARYREDGLFFETPKKFPAALTSPNGYVVFDSLQSLRNSEFVTIGPNNLKKTNIKPPGISALPGFVPARLEPLGEIFEKEPLGPEGYVYAITNPAFPGWVKVGKAHDEKARLKNYQTGDPHRSYEISVKEWFDNRSDAENRAHEELKKITSNWNGEWFQLKVSVVERVLKNL